MSEWACWCQLGSNSISTGCSTYCQAFKRCCRNAVSIARRVSPEIFHRIASHRIASHMENSLAGLRLFFLSGCSGFPSWDSMESMWSTPRAGSAIVNSIDDKRCAMRDVTGEMTGRLELRMRFCVFQGFIEEQLLVQDAVAMCGSWSITCWAIEAVAVHMAGCALELSERGYCCSAPLNNYDLQHSNGCYQCIIKLSNFT